MPALLDSDLQDGTREVVCPAPRLGAPFVVFAGIDLKVEAPDPLFTRRMAGQVGGAKVVATLLAQLAQATRDDCPHRQRDEARTITAATRSSTIAVNILAEFNKEPSRATQPTPDKENKTDAGCWPATVWGDHRELSTG